MAHFTKLLSNSKYLGAINFTDDNMRPREIWMTLAKITWESPPANNKEQKACFHFQETPKGWFPSNGQIKALANLLMQADDKMWIGAQLLLTCEEVKSTKGGKTMGVVIRKATRAKDAKPIPANNPEVRETEVEPENEQATDAS